MTSKDLALGTVVKVKDKKLIIITKDINNEKGDFSENLKYGGVTFPEGLKGPDSVVHFTSNDIAEILFEGLNNEAKLEK